MFDFFRKKRIEKFEEQASQYVKKIFVKEPSPVVKPNREDTEIKYSLRKASREIKYSLRDELEEQRKAPTHREIRYSDRGSASDIDRYNLATVAQVMRNYSKNEVLDTILKGLNNTVNQTFVDKLIYYINAKGMRDSKVYKAAQIDRRLFSKIMSDRQYKPAKDTAIALVIALELSLEQAHDLLSRAGYTFSHSNKKDIIIEYFIRERVYNLTDINEVLYKLGEKIIGR